MIIYVLYLAVAAIVVGLSDKAAEYVDLLDKKTKLSGAFIGGVMLSAVTSLPEMFTSISATLMLDKPGLCIGNILGSDLFNLVPLSVMMLICWKNFGGSKIAKGHTTVSVAVLAIYGVMFLNMYHILDISVFSVNLTSVIILLIYILGIKVLSGEDGGSEEDESDSDLTVPQVIVRFIAASIGLVVASIIITYITDEIAMRLQLGNGLAGALFLGIATSLPELSSTVSLFKRRNYNIAIGNIVGSNLFNFFILSVVDLLYWGKGVYDFSDPSTVNLMIFGAISTPVMMVLLKKNNRFTQFVCPVICILCYFGFLLL